MDKLNRTTWPAVDLLESHRRPIQSNIRFEGFYWLNAGLMLKHSRLLKFAIFEQNNQWDGTNGFICICEAHDSCSRALKAGKI